MNYYISDMHFGHKNVLHFDNRPFKTIEENDETLIMLWNQTVTKNDDIYILGDFCWGKIDEWQSIVPRLVGRKHLILGNHDLKDSGALRKLFVSVANYSRIKDNERTVVLCHFPMPVYDRVYYGGYHLFGHTHLTEDFTMTENFIDTVCSYYEVERKAFNVGCMMPWMQYRPRTLDEIEANYKRYKEVMSDGISQ